MAGLPWSLHVPASRERPNMPTHEANDLAIWAPDKLVVVKEKVCNSTCRRHWAKFSERARSNESVKVLVEARAAADAPKLNDELFGWNMEVTRLNIWAGLSAQLVANRLFASQDGGQWVPRWSRIGSAFLGPSGSGVSGHAGTYSVHCRLPLSARAVWWRGTTDMPVSVIHHHGQPACGVRQAAVKGGWTSATGMSGSGIALLAGRPYEARLVLRSTGGPAHVTFSLDAPGGGPIYAQTFSGTFSGVTGLAAGGGGGRGGGEGTGWATREFTFIPNVTVPTGAILSISATSGEDSTPTPREYVFLGGAPHSWEWLGACAGLHALKCSCR